LLENCQGNNEAGIKFCLNACSLLPAAFLLGLLFNPEDGGDVFLKNVR
jgi:hypothetical protein